ncbi:F-box family protein [Rhynchospora pubera]|uniref:F-box family protein n=1 Tax=Rhynchospora pubera TaxID=906938 RepID=A0AAV8EYB8_9POAL|nr:F-box family protein [Rhynchospora pubera]
MEGWPCGCVLLDWAHLLPADVVHLISEKLKSITDYVRFRAVCSPWRSASLPKPSHFPPQLPWLMIPYEPWCSDSDDGTRLFYDLFESKMRKLLLPETIGHMCSASYRGWLLLVETKGTEVFLLNPLTRARVDLPSFTTPVRYLKGKSSAPCYDARWVFGYNFVITRVTFSADLTDPNCLIMVFVERCWGLFCCRVGDPCWTMVNIRPSNAPTGDAAFYNGCFYLFSKGVMYITEFNKPEKLVTCFLEDKLRDSDLFLLEGKSGLHVVAVRDTKIEDEEAPGQGDEHHTSADNTTEGNEKGVKQTFELYQLYHDSNKKYSEEPPPEMFPMHLHSDLKKITDTSSTTIFYGEKHHFLAVCSDDWDSLDGDCMYIEHKDEPSPGKDHGGEYYDNYYSISFAKIGGTECQTVACEIAGEPPIWPPAPAMWFQPSYV